MKIFITGIAGFLGSHLADHLIAQGHDVTGCDNLFGGEHANCSGLHPGQWCETDILDDLFQHMRGIDVVYHCAAAAYEGASVFAPRFISENIYTGSASVFTAAIQAGVRRIVFCSSMARYGNGVKPFREDQPCAPCDPYGIAKLAAEDLLRNLAAVHGFEWNIAVPHNIYGPRQRYVDPYRNVAAIMANLMLQNRAPVIYGDGNQQRCFSYVDDVVPCLALLGTSTEVTGAIVNLGPDEEPVTINELAQRLRPWTGYNGEAYYVPDRPQEVRHAVCSADKARALLGYRTTVSLDHGLGKLVEFIRERGPKPFEYHFDLEIKSAKTPRTWTERLF